jgi:short-chain fatty acids transporter
MTPAMSKPASDGWLQQFSTIVARWVPDAISAGVILTIVMVGVALAFANAPIVVMDAYYRGLWMLLPFTMQMTLVIVLSLALGVTPFFRRAIAVLSRLPKTKNQLVALAFLATAFVSYLYWGLGYALGPIVAVYFATEGERKGVAVDFPFLLAVTSVAQAAWQYGFSSSAPLLVATEGHFLQDTIGVIPLTATIWSPAAIIHEIAFSAAVIGAGCWLMPKIGRPISQFPDSCKVAVQMIEEAEDGHGLSFSARLERSPLVTLALCAMLAAWIGYHFLVKRLSLDINSLNATLLFLTFLLHGNVKRFTHAVQQGVSASWAVIVLYHLYAGIAGLIQFTDVGERAALAAASIATEWTFPLITALSGALFSFFIPSSGGQWTVQGFVITKAAMAVGVSVPRAILALGIGDHMGNFTTPFWYVVVAGIARLDFRSFFGYGLIFAAIWFVIGVVVFTFAPC